MHYEEDFIMKNYTLQKDETILYRGSVNVLPEGKKGTKGEKQGDILLTNYNIVITSERKKFLKTETEVEMYSVSDVKVHDEKVQVVRRKAIVDVYLKGAEVFLDFGKEKEAKAFCDIAHRLISGESKFVRSVKRARKEIRETDEALDTNFEGAISASAGVVANIAVGVSKLEGVGMKTKVAGVIANVLLNSKKKKEEKSLCAPETVSEEQKVDEE